MSVAFLLPDLGYVRIRFRIEVGPHTLKRLCAGEDPRAFHLDLAVIVDDPQAQVMRASAAERDLEISAFRGGREGDGVPRLLKQRLIRVGCRFLALKTDAPVPDAAVERAADRHEREDRGDPVRGHGQREVLDLIVQLIVFHGERPD